MARRVASWVLLIVGGLVLALAVPAGYLNRTVLDAPTTPATTAPTSATRNASWPELSVVIARWN